MYQLLDSWYFVCGRMKNSMCVSTRTDTVTQFCSTMKEVLKLEMLMQR